MAGLREIKTRIESVKSTWQMTSAMKLVSASKLRKTQKITSGFNFYVSKMTEIFRNLQAEYQDQAMQFYFTDHEKIRNIVVVVITSDKGLCGTFNNNTIKAAEKMIDTNYAEQKKNGSLRMICLGGKGRDYFQKAGYTIHELSNLKLEPLSFEQFTPLAEMLIEGYTKKQIDRVEFVYQKSVTTSSQQIHVQRFLPFTKIVAKGKIQNSETNVTNLPSDIIFLPNKKEVLTELMPYMLRLYAYYIILDASMAEHAARMIAMSQASENASDLLKVLNRNHNKMRQAKITNDLLDIMNGANALMGL